VILRSPFAGAESVALLQIKRPNGQLSGGIPRDVYERIEASLPPSVVATGASTIAPPIVTRVDTPRRTQTECITSLMPRVLGTVPLMGRWFDASEGLRGAPAVAVVSLKFWRGTLGSDPHVIGRTIALDGVPVTILGVMPAGFDGPHSRLNRDIWVPYDLNDPKPPFGCRPGGATFNVMLRLQPGVSMDAGAQALNGVAGIRDLVLVSSVEGMVGDLRSPFSALVGAVLAVLLIAFANVTNLGLERLAGRRRELSIRIAMGATRSRIIRETVAEHLLISLLGAVAGVGIAFVSFDAMIALLPEWLPNVAAVSLNGRVLAAAVMLAILGGIGSGLVSAMHASAASLRGGLAAGDRGHTRGSTFTRRILVASELALGVLLLVGALLMIQTFLTLRPSSPGFDANDKYIALVRLPADSDNAERVSFVNAVSDSLRTVPGIREVAATTSVPMRRTVAVIPAAIGAAAKSDIHTGAVTPNYFDMMHVPLRGGRGLTAADTAAAPPVAVVNEAFVRRWFADSQALGTTVTLNPGTKESASFTIVGVVGDTRSFGSDTKIRPFLYMPMAQSIFGSPYFFIHAEPRVAATLPPVVRGIVERLRPGQLVDEIEVLQDEMSAEVAQPRLGAWLFGLFAGLAVLLGAVGLAATLAWSVAQRRREIGIRMALGAKSSDVRRLVVGQMLGLSLAGITAGLLAASASTVLLKSWLYGVTPLDPMTFAACGALMLAVSAVAAYVPARRATRVSPLIALRGD
jgi:putative ABC transport system permease protein